jgi:hypothetical protein
LYLVVVDIVAHIDVVHVVSTIVNQIKVIGDALLLNVLLNIGDVVVTSRECDVQSGSGSSKGKDKTEVLVVVIGRYVVPAVWDGCT